MCAPWCCLAFLTACSSLKTAYLRDARILKTGESEIAGELATTAVVERTSLRLAEPHDAVVRSLADSIDWPRQSVKTDLPMLAAEFSHGLAHGFELSGGFGTGMLPGGAIMIDLGLKKRLYANRLLFLSAGVGAAAGWSSNRIEYGTSDSLFHSKSFLLRSRTLEADATVMALFKVLPMLSLYYDLGVTGGNLAYKFKNVVDSSAGNVEGDEGMRGIRNHIGVVLEFTYAEIALEQGFLFYAHEYVPSLGLRWSFKDGWKE